MKNQYLKLMLVTNKGISSVEDYLKFIAIAIKNGITSVQLREPDLEYNNLLEFGKRLKALLDLENIPLIINDDINLCLKLGAHGVHLGQTDTDVKTAREILGRQKTIGLTVNNLAQIEIANNLPVDYIGVGAVFYTKRYKIKENWGIEGLKQAVAISKYPIIAIGGINEQNADVIIKTGATGIAAIGAFHESLDIKMTTQILKSIVNNKDYYNDRTNKRSHY